MGTPASLSKLTFLVIAVAGLEWGGTSEQFRLLACFSLLLLAFAFVGGRLFLWFWSLRNANGSHFQKLQAGKNPYWPIDRWAYVFLWLPMLLWSFSVRLEQMPKIVAPPQIWREWEKAPPNYQESLVANVKVSKQIGLGRFLVSVQLLRSEKRTGGRHQKTTQKFYKPYKRYWKETKGDTKGPTKSSFYKTSYTLERRRRRASNPKFYAPNHKRYQNRKRYKSYQKGNGIYKAHKGSSLYKANKRWKNYKRHQGFQTYRRYKKYKTKNKKYQKKEKWHLQKAFAADSLSARPFPAILKLSGKDGLYKGCLLRMRIYGRGVPRLINGGFADWVHRQGAASYWRASARYHLLESKCPKPELRDALRLEVLQLLKNNIQKKEVRNLMQALLLGRSSYLSHNLKQHIRKLGILHLFAASGLHLGIFYLCFFLPLGYIFGKRHPAALLLSLLPCGFAVWFLDFPISIVRAFLFLSLHTLFLLRYKRLLRSHLILTSMVLVLFYSPKDFLGMGSCLSFGAVGGIFAFFSVLDELAQKRPFWIRLLWKQYALGVSASAFTTPLLLYYFRAYGFVSPLANLLFVPLMGLLLPLLYLCTALALLGFFPEGFLKLMFLFLEKAFLYFLRVTKFLPGEELYVKFSSFWSLPVLASALLLVSLLYFAWLSQKSKARRLARKPTGPAKHWERSTTCFFRFLLFLGLLLLGPIGRAWV